MKYMEKMILLLILLGLSIGFNSALAEAGVVIYVLGKVQKKDASGSLIRIRKNDVIESGDTLMTAKNGQAMIFMLDKNKITIRPNTEFIIDDYVFEGNVKKDKSHYELMKGGLRSASGMIAKKNKKSFQLKTSIATMGIRGTDFDLGFCESTCTDNKGIFVKVITGGVSLSNDAGTMDIDVGDIGHVTSFDDQPKLVNELPENMRIGKNKSRRKTGDDSDSYPTHEEEMVAIALHKKPNGDMFQELVDSELPTRDILKGAVSIGMDPIDVVEILLQISPDTDEIIEQAIDAFPEKASDFTTMGIVLGDLSDNALKKLQAKPRVDPKAIQKGKSLGQLISPRGRKEKKREKLTQREQPSTGTSHNTAAKPKFKPKKIPTFDKELLPGKGTGGGNPASPS